ncbi:MAG: hypothetical protein ACR2HM_03560 [Acidimicrobiales bacterium]
MADETTQAEEETSWWVFDAFADSELPSTSLDEPLVWPEAIDWGDVGGDDEHRYPGIPDLGASDLSEPIIFPVSPCEEPAAPAAPAPGPASGTDDGLPTMAVPTPLAGLGGGAALAPERAGDRNVAARSVPKRLPDSIWADTPPAAVAARAAASSPAPSVGTEHGDHGGRRRFDLRHGNATVIALISLVSLVLLGMFMSVRARNNLPTETSTETRTTSDQIAVQGTLNTVPLSIPTTLAGPSPTIDIAGLLPAADDSSTGSGSQGSGGSGGSTATTAPARVAPAGGGTATTQPATQPTNTTAPATTVAPATTTPPVTSPAIETTTPTSRRTTSSISRPTWPDPTGTEDPATPYTLPTFPTGFRG